MLPALSPQELARHEAALAAQEEAARAQAQAWAEHVLEEEQRRRTAARVAAISSAVHAAEEPEWLKTAAEILNSPPRGAEAATES